MMKNEEMITLIGNMFINAYVAGDRKDLDSFRSARADRVHLFDEIRNLYAELEHESYEREQYQVELKEANEKIKAQQKELNRLNEEIGRRIDEKRAIFNGNPPTLGMKLRLSEIYGKKISHVDDRSLYPSRKPDEEVPDHHDAFDAMFPGCTPDDLPFPEVEDLADAADVEGSDE